MIDKMLHVVANFFKIVIYVLRTKDQEVIGYVLGGRTLQQSLKHTPGSDSFSEQSKAELSS